jgi:hypothetical protein
LLIDMPGGRDILGSDVRAALRNAAAGEDQLRALRARVPDDLVLTGLDDLARRCPPAELGMSPGRYAALFAPLFGEFE